MNDEERRAVRPCWVCELGDGGDEARSRDEWRDFADELKAKARKKREDELDEEFEKAFGHKPGEGNDDLEVEDSGGENGNRMVRSLL